MPVRKFRSLQEMEDTLVEIKSSCAGAIATQKKLEREQTEVGKRVAHLHSSR